jgi:hypothetical protein
MVIPQRYTLWKAVAALTAPGEEGGTSVAAWTIDKGKPLATQVP